MSRLGWLVMAASFAGAGCSVPTTRLTEPEKDPDGGKRLEEVRQISNRNPSRWSPAVTIPLYPVLLTADTSIKLVNATGQWIVEVVELVAALFGGSPSLPPPDAVERAAEGLRQK